MTHTQITEAVRASVLLSPVKSDRAFEASKKKGAK
jgi:hypothetical protein